MSVLRHVTSLQILAENSFSGALMETSDCIRNPFNAKMVAGTFNDTEQEQFIDVSSYASLKIEIPTLRLPDYKEFSK
jgi:hypothetical protein